MKIAHWVYHLIRGGTEGQCARTAMGLAARGWSQRVVVFRRYGHFLDSVEAACGPVREVRIRHVARWSTWRECRSLARWLQTEKIDLLHTWDADAAIFGSFAAQWAGIPLVTSRRDLGAIYPAWKQTLLRRADHRAVRVVVNAEAIRTHFLQEGVPEAKMVFMPNIVDGITDGQTPALDETCLPSGRRLVVVNRLDPEKNTGLLLEALRDVRREEPSAVLVVVGDGIERAALEARAAALGLSDAVAFLGEINQIPSLLPHCEIGALVPRANEGLSNTILEYMAAGLPVMATDCGGNAELVADGVRGRLLPLHAVPSEVAACWLELLRQPELGRRWGEAGRAFVRERYSLRPALDAWEAFYRSLDAFASTSRSR